MALSLEQLKNAFAQKTEVSTSSYWDKFFPFYKIDDGARAVIRFLPDSNEENPMGFLVENKYHTLIINGKQRKIACLRMYDEACPCCELSAKHYKDKNDVMGKKYYRKLDYIAQAIVKESPIEVKYEENGNPVKLVSISKSLYDKIKTAITGDMDAMPFDLMEGYDFRINKTRKGEWADYSTSDFARKSSAVDEDTIARMDLYDLSKFRFGRVEREAMETMIQADLTGTELTEDGDESDTPSSTAITGSSQVVAPVAKQVIPSTDTTPSIRPDTASLLATIRARNAAKTAA